LSAIFNLLLSSAAEGEPGLLFDTLQGAQRQILYRMRDRDAARLATLVPRNNARCLGLAVEPHASSANDIAEDGVEIGPMAFGVTK
jgi:hypothetical protein